MKITLIETGLIRALLNPLCPVTSIDTLYYDYETTLSNLVNSLSLSSIEIIRELDYVLCELAAVRACNTQKKYAVLCN